DLSIKNKEKNYYIDSLVLNDMDSHELDIVSAFKLSRPSINIGIQGCSAPITVNTGSANDFTKITVTVSNNGAYDRTQFPPCYNYSNVRNCRYDLAKQLLKKNCNCDLFSEVVKDGIFFNQTQDHSRFSTFDDFNNCLSGVPITE